MLNKNISSNKGTENRARPKKRIAAVLLALCAAAVMLSVTAFATSVNPPDPPSSSSSLSSVESASKPPKKPSNNTDNGSNDTTSVRTGADEIDDGKPDAGSEEESGKETEENKDPVFVFIEKTEAIGEVDGSEECGQKIAEARKAYGELSAEERKQGQVKEGLLTLESKEKRYKELSAEKPPAEEKPKKQGGSVVIILAASAAVLFGASAAAVVLFEKKKTGRKTVVQPAKQSDEITEIIPIGNFTVPSGSVWVTSSSIIGTREYQQDSVLVPEMKGMTTAELEQKGYLCVLCDGMGGLQGGERASKACAEAMFESYYGTYYGFDVKKAMREGAECADERVSKMRDNRGNPLHSGTTMTCVLIKDGRLMHCSVGDSRIYIYRNGTVSQLSHDHNYFEDLIRGHQPGSPEWRDAFINPKRDALTSYIGMGGIKHFDISESPIMLEKGDIIFMCSDGLYRSVGEEEMAAAMRKYSDHLEFLPHVLTATAFDAGKVHQDNTSIITIKYLG